MEAGLAAGYAAETAAEGVVGAGIAVASSTMPLRGTWKRISIGDPLPRSSHSLNVIKGMAYIFGGEIRPRVPVDNDMHLVTLPLPGADADHRAIPASGFRDGPVPPSRVGHTADAIGEYIYVFGGRGGKEMSALAENGRVWVYDTTTHTWTYLDPVGSPYPEPRSYHASTASAHPLQTSHDDRDSRFDPKPVDTEPHGTLFVSGGCLSQGRALDVWGFDIASRTWSRYPDPPGPARGGQCLTHFRDCLYRFGGFDGKNELGGQVDHLDVSSISERSGKGQLPVATHSGQWESVTIPMGTGPGNRSVAGLQAITTGQGRNYLLLLLGERDASASGHDGAGQFWDDVWSFQLQSESMTAASLKDATRRLFRAKTGDGSWAEVLVPESSMAEGELDTPGPRGWFATSRNDIDPTSIVLWGGLTSNNERAGDGWILTVDT